MNRYWLAAASAALLFASGWAQAQTITTVGPGFSFDSEALVGTNPPTTGTTGGLTVVPHAFGRSVFVGVGPAFDDAASALVRFDQRLGAAGDWEVFRMTTLATGFTSISGAFFDSRGFNPFDGTGGTLYWVDNGLVFNSEEIGDGVFALPSPVVADTTVSGATLAVSAAGSTPSASDITRAPVPITVAGVGDFPAGTLLVSATPFGAGESLFVVQPDTGAVSAAGFDAVPGYAGGVAFDAAGVFYFAYTDAMSGAAVQLGFSPGAIDFANPAFTRTGNGSSDIAFGDATGNGREDMILAGGSNAGFTECNIVAVDLLTGVTTTLFEGAPSTTNPFGCFTGAVAWDRGYRDLLFTDGVGVTGELYELDGNPRRRRRHSSGCDVVAGPVDGAMTWLALALPGALLLARRARADGR